MELETQDLSTDLLMPTTPQATLMAETSGLPALATGGNCGETVCLDHLSRVPSLGKKALLDKSSEVRALRNFHILSYGQLDFESYFEVHRRTLSKSGWGGRHQFPALCSVLHVHQRAATPCCSEQLHRWLDQSSCKAAEAREEACRFSLAKSWDLLPNSQCIWRGKRSSWFSSFRFLAS